MISTSRNEIARKMAKDIVEGVAERGSPDHLDHSEDFPNFLSEHENDPEDFPHLFRADEKGRGESLGMNENEDVVGPWRGDMEGDSGRKLSKDPKSFWRRWYRRWGRSTGCRWCKK